LTDSVIKVLKCLTTFGIDCGLGDLGGRTGIDWKKRKGE